MYIVTIIFNITFTFSHLADAFIQSDLQLGLQYYSIFTVNFI